MSRVKGWIHPWAMIGGDSSDKSEPIYVEEIPEGYAVIPEADIKVLAEAVLKAHTQYIDCDDCKHVYEDCQFGDCPTIPCQCDKCQTARKYAGGKDE